MTTELEPSKADRELIVKGFALFLEHGALSLERLTSLLGKKYQSRDSLWVLSQLSCEKNSLELYTLPDCALPKNYRTW